MSKVLLFSDIHIYAHKKRIECLHDCFNVLEWVFKTAKSNNISNIIFPGDLFQDRQWIDIFTYHKTFDIISKHCSDELKLWLLLGNHDMWFSNKWECSSIKPFSAIKGVTVIDKPTTHVIEGVEVDFLPYTHHPVQYLFEFKESLKVRKGRKTLIGHLAVDGAQLNALHNTRADVIIEHDGDMIKIGPDLFVDWDQVWLGHYHGYQKIRHPDVEIEYVGSTHQLTFGEAFQHKYIIIYDLKSGEKEFIKNTFSPQHFIIPEKDIDKYDLEKNFIRVEVDGLGTSDMIDFRKKVQTCKPGSFEIIPAKKEEKEHLIEDAKAILYKEDEMLEKYVEQVDVGDLNKGLLVEFGKKICTLQS